MCYSKKSLANAPIRERKISRQKGGNETDRKSTEKINDNDDEEDREGMEKKRVTIKINHFGAVVVAQWVEQLLPSPQIRGTRLIIGNFYFLSSMLKLY